jgi:hypothetical protein
MRLPHSCTPSNPSVCAFQDAIDRNERVEVTTTRPEKSPEYTRSLSLEIARQLTSDECERIICFGVGGLFMSESESNDDRVM